ncbi:uncharacterized protein TRIADDRAFT_56320 [Trichoplax adhaerens]|uniref:Tetratricopeptide repeat protein 29 n=1 Tax=Trichoplax adhaerens TaxID=10228 RepID=B3RXT2_TRIAD|nr:hypothetical protein TRIADDRAFT_56320 [Trichoplax adhaerens]EDV24911.1 hypothetical protein TRIADDRAFT_56320 [Trichoplax adhaerens]|eukprot:XP_002112801.1 hypothetical protein TRIADDRAFT_56320 [Trichoplax adhaerens]
MSSTNILPMIDPNLGKSNIKPSPPTTPPHKNTINRSTRNIRPINGHNKQKKQKHPVVQETYDKKIDVARYRNDYMHNLCMDILKEGYHRAFAEIFELINRQKEEREALGDDIIATLTPLLKDEHEKLSYLSEKLCRAEDAERNDDQGLLYRELKNLAVYFENHNDSWLSDHFYFRCLEIAQTIEHDDGKTQSEANCNLGVSLVDRGENNEALPYLEEFYNLTKNRDWINDDGQQLFPLACEHLCRVYTAIAAKTSRENSEVSIKFLLQAYDVAKEGGSKHAEGITSYRLGRAFSENGDPQMALTYHNSYLEICQQEGDDIGAARAYEAMASCYESQDDIENTFKNLEKFATVAEKCNQQKEFGKACTKLGGIFNSMGNYSKAVEYFGKAFKVAQEMTDTEVLDEARVQYGIARAHKMTKDYMKFININNRESLRELLSWKSTRQAAFSNDEADSDPNNPSNT